MCSVASLCAIGFPACSDDYDDTDIKKEIQDVKDRVAKLEEWQKTVNSDITSLQGLVEALQGKNFITDVTPVTENGVEVGYTISFQTGKSITIRHGENGKDGQTPVIGVAKDGDVYYWTVKTGDAEAEFMTDADGNKMPVTGPKGEAGADAVAPQLRINSDNNEWELSTDGGESWTATGVKATGDKGDKGDKGDAVFAEDGIDLDSDPDNVIFTLADGTTLTVPKAATVWVGFDSYDTYLVTPTTKEISILLPETLQETDYVALVAEVRSASGTGMDIVTKADPQAWKVTLTEPTFVEGVCQNDAKVKIESMGGVSNGEKAVLKITLINGSGKEFSASRVIEYFNGIVIDVEQAGGLAAAIKAAMEESGLSEREIKGLKVKGTMEYADFLYICDNLPSVECVDVSGTDITELKNWSLGFNDDTPNTTIKEIVLPEGLVKIGNSAFRNCKSLEKLVIPSTVTEFGRWMIRGCKNLKNINIPAGVTVIPESCFYDAGLSSVDIPNTVTTIGNWAFDSCPLESVVIPESVTSLGTPLDPPYAQYTFGSSRCWEDESVVQLREVEIKANVTWIPDCCFGYQTKLAKVTLPDCVKIIGADAFSGSPIESIVLPADLEELGARAFAYAKFTTLTIPSKVTKIANAAFNGVKLSTIDLPATITSLHATSFNWEDATTVICRATAVPETPQYDDFNNKFPPFYLLKSGCKLQVPAESLEAYKSAWGEYFGEDNIEAIK